MLRSACLLFLLMAGCPSSRTPEPASEPVQAVVPDLEPVSEPAAGATCREDADCVVTNFAGCCDCCGCTDPSYAIAARQLEIEVGRCALVDCDMSRCAAIDCIDCGDPSGTATCVDGACVYTAP